MAGVVRAGLSLLALVLVLFKGIQAKPFFPSLWCNIACIEYDDGLDDSASTTTTLDQLMDSIWDPCSGCPVQPSRPTTTPIPPGMPWSLFFPPSMVGMNITALNGFGPPGGYVIQPWNNGMPPLPFPGTPSPVAAAATPAPAAAATPAPAAAAPAAATTAAAAGAATTVAPTTAAP